MVISINTLAIEFSTISSDRYKELASLDSNDLKYRLSSHISKGTHSVSYGKAKEIIFRKLDNENGMVCGVYSSGKCMRTSNVPSHKKMNLEHTWPQSKGATGKAKSDLHHLFPTYSHVNSRRSNLPFCDVEKIKWFEHGSKMGKDSKEHNCFEPPENHKGNVARAMFYFSLRYKMKLDQTQELTLRKWHQLDPVDEEERVRNQKIFNYQHNSNPFIEKPEFVDLISDF